MPKIPKTVYVLGAGFSTPAGGPDQSSLVEAIFSLPSNNAKTTAAKESLRRFLVDVLQFDWAKKSNIALEDIYTPIDRCLVDGISLRGMPLDDVRTLRGQMEYLISLAIDRAFDIREAKTPGASAYVQHFAEYLVEIASGRAERAKVPTTKADEAKDYDPVSVISLNWDILLDKSLYRALHKRDGGRTGDYEPIGVVDYCCYISSFQKTESRIRPGLWALGSRGYNIKLLKVHGSMNWLQCSNCQRLFVSFDEKVNIPNFINAEMCRHCSDCGVNATLQGALVMPTFLKDLSSFQLKVIWQNAAVELMEASKLVFIGYSLPHADFEFRQLLSRTVREKCEIDVVLFHDDKLEKKRRFREACDRYRQFFGKRKLHTRHDGVAGFVHDLMVSTGRWIV